MRFLVLVTGLLCVFPSVFVAAAEVANLGRSPELLERIAASRIAPVSPAFKDALGLSGIEDLELIQSEEKSRGLSISRYRQSFRGVPVWGRQIIVESDTSGQVKRLKGQLVRGLAAEINTIRPGLKRTDAINAMQARVRAGFGPLEPVFERAKGELVVYVSEEGTANLSYAVSFLADSADGGHPTRPTFIVDAFTGDVLLEYDALAHQGVACSTGCTLLNQSNLSAVSGWKNYSIIIPSSVQPAARMVITMTGGTGDADLYVRKNSVPTLGAYDCRPYLNGNKETCSVTVNPDETWYIGIYAFTSYSGVSLTAEVMPPYEHVGSGPGGNDKIGLYYFGREYPELAVTRNATLCTMNNTNVKTVHLHNGTSGSSAFAYGDGVDCFNDADYVNGGHSALNDAHYFGGIVYDMYNAYLSEPPLTFQLMMRVHYSTGYENAFWDGSSMTFGDGANVFHPLVSLDVTSHEVSHGYTEQRSNLVYTGQSGGINEAFSDIGGEAAEYFMRGSTDFLVGADIVKASGGYLRNMCNPTADGKSIDNIANYTNGLDVHYSSGVYNKAFCLLAKTPGWNAKDAFIAFANANRYCWTSSINFANGAQCVVDEAGGRTDVNGLLIDTALDRADIATAFQGVGISGLNLGGPPGTPTLTVVNAGITAAQIPLAWADVVGETSYSLLRSADGVLFTEIAPLGADTTSYTDSNLPPATKYYYKLLALNSEGQKESGIVNATTLSSASTSTGFRQPAANFNDTGGDGNGYNKSPAQAYVADGAVAQDPNSGTTTSTSCTNTGKDRHRYYNYGFTIPADAVIKGIEVKLRARADNVTGSPFICVQLSADAGTTWTSPISTPTLGTTLSDFSLGGAGNLWGRTTWPTSAFSNANFRVRIVDVASRNARDFFLDAVSVNVTY